MTTHNTDGELVSGENAHLWDSFTWDDFTWDEKIQNSTLSAESAHQPMGGSFVLTYRRRKDR